VLGPRASALNSLAPSPALARLPFGGALGAMAALGRV